MYKVLSAESCSGGDTQQQHQCQWPASQNPPSKNPHPPSENLLYPVVNKEVELQFSKLSLPIIGYSCAYVKFSYVSHNPLSTQDIFPNERLNRIQKKW
jgi:hypothetical protein